MRKGKMNASHVVRLSAFIGLLFAFIPLFLTPSFGAITSLFTDNFDSETAGSDPASWALSQTYGDINVNDTQAFSSPNSMFFTDTGSGAGQIIYAEAYTQNFTDTTQPLNVTFWIYLISVQDSVFIHIGNNASTYGITIDFDSDGNVYSYPANTKTASGCTWTANTWEKWTIMIYLNNDTKSIYKDGTFCSNSAFREYDGEIDVVNKYRFSTSSTGTEKFHVDDFSVKYGTETTSISIFEPQEGATYYQTNITLNLTVTDPFLTQFHVKYWVDGSLEYDNASYVNATNVVNWTSLGVGSHNFTVWANGTEEVSQSVIFTIASHGEEVLSYENTILEGSIQTYTLRYRFNPDAVSSMSADLIFNGTNQGSSTASYNTTHYTFTKSIGIPLVSDTSASVSFYFNVTLTYTNGTSIYFNSSSGNQTIYKVTLASSGTTPTLNITVKNEQTQEMENGTADMVFYINYPSGAERNFSFSFENQTYYTIYLSPSWAEIWVDGEASYYGNGYSTREYYWTNATLNNVTSESVFYLLPTSESNGITFHVYDEAYRDVANAIVKLERWYPETASYQYVTMTKTDAGGEGFTYVEFYDAYYKITVERNGEVVYTEDKKKFTSNTYDIVLQPSDLLEYFQFTSSVSYSVEWDGSVYRISVTDTSGKVTSGRLEGVKTTWFKTGDVCSASGSGASFTLICDLTNETGTITLNTYVTFSGDEYLLVSDTYSLTTPTSSFGLSGIFAAFFLVGTLVFAFLVSPFISILITIFMIVVVHLLKLVVVGEPYLISLVLAGVIIAYLVREK